MKYIVMECNLSYAVVLDEDGRFLKVANRQYEVGQTVTDVIVMQVPHAIPQKKNIKRWLVPVAAVAACLIIALIFVLQLEYRTFASIYMSINPEVRIDVNRRDVVVGLEGVNIDGEHLIESYNYKKKHVDTVINDLLDRAIDMGYLLEGGQISFVFDAESGEWIVNQSDSLEKYLSEHLGKRISVTIVLTDKKTDKNKVIIPIVPDKSDYDDSDYGETRPTAAPSGTSGAANSDYTDYDSNYGDDSDYDDGQTDYGDSSYDDDSDYDDPSNPKITQGDAPDDNDDSDYDDPIDDDSDYDNPIDDESSDDDSDYVSSDDDDSDYDPFDDDSEYD
ncbi:MAG: anti-sigma-I factor RsgI family protein [Saccharofermentanales bacterium]|jgi:hypothetical protein